MEKSIEFIKFLKRKIQVLTNENQKLKEELVIKNIKIRELTENKVREELIDNETIYALILETANYLKDKLPPSPYHPKGRNSNAHMFMMIRKKFGVSYSMVEDTDKLIKYIDHLKNHPC
tara:strand:- start:9707 stop:10063 length:357 start_codon:yes stop_codon:yes gene_type:complete